MTPIESRGAERNMFLRPPLLHQSIGSDLRLFKIESQAMLSTAFPKFVAFLNAKER